MSPGEGRSSAALLEEPKTGVDSWAWLSVGWLIRSRYMPTRRKAAFTSLFYIVCLPSWAWLSVGWLIRSRYMPTRRKSHLLAYFTLCVCRPGLGSAWAGSLGPGTFLQEESLIYLLILHCVFAVLGLAQRGLAH